MKKLVELVLVVSSLLAMAGCSSNSSSSTSTESDEVVLTIGISPDYAPYESENTSGEIVGFDPDMIKLFEQYLTEEEGVTYKLELKKMDFDNIVTQLQGDQIDLGISGFTYAEERKVEWSEPYLGTSQVAVVPEGSDINTVEDLKGKKLVVQTGATGEQAANEVEDAEVTGLKNVQDIMNALAANQYDAAIVDIGVAKNYVENGNFSMIEESLMDEQNYVIAKQGNTELIEKINKCIEKFLASDEYSEMCEEYGLSPLETK
jgi:arginine/lysine/histidine transporter system substrate-binding protein